MELRSCHPKFSVKTRNAPRAGFTFVEVVVGVTIIGVVASSIMWGLTQLNHYATVNRLYTAAQTLAQNQIDLILTKGPYDPAQGKYPDPNILGTSAQVAGGATYTYYSDPTTPGTLYTAARNVKIHTDPMSGNQIVQGTIKTDVKDTGMTVSVNGTPTALDLRQATVTVSYTFRNRPYTVVMDTMRTSDK